SKELNAQMLPQIYNGATSWEEVNLYAYDLLINHQLNLKTIQTEMLHLNAYANWLETQENLNWLTFPDKRSERCLVRFRAELIKQRENRKIS
ncbi:site-specific integrase, partial [Escherichia coli]|nr:site-specific integrase [Escherichia coli]